MEFTKSNKKAYCDKELESNISNSFTFTMKDLIKGKKINDPPPTCLKCFFPLIQPKCMQCDEINQVDFEGKDLKNVVYKETLGEENQLVESMILCIDLSGSMNISYSSTFQKVNEDFAIRVIGKENFDFLKKTLGADKVLKNYKIIEDLLNEGESPRNIFEMYKEDEHRSQKSEEHQQLNTQNEVGYITRKEIVEISVSKYIEMIKSRNPSTLITVVYFSDKIEIPVNNFNDKIIIPNIEDKNLQEVIQLGAFYANDISIEKASIVGDKLIKNLTKMEANGQTALTPALAFCTGLAKSFEHSLHQIVIVTDGLSNIGFGQTEEDLEVEETKKLYEHIGLQYSKKFNCVFNVITFQDCVIGYDVIDQLVGISGGLPCQIGFQTYKGESIISDNTMSMLSFALADNFIGAMKQFGYKTKLAIKCSNPKIKLTIPNELKTCVKKNNGNEIFLELGIKSIAYIFKISFSLVEKSEEGFEDENMRFTILNSFQRGKKKRLLIYEEGIKVKKGTTEEAQKEETKVLEKIVKQKLQHRQFFQEDVNEYKEIEEKLNNENIAKQFDEKMLEKFKVKKQKIEDLNHKMDKLTRQKMSMASRTYRTFQEKEDIDDDDGFK